MAVPGPTFLGRALEPTSTGWMNAARALAIVFVVAIHNTSDTVETRFAAHLSAPWWTATWIDGAARWSVPVFIMISGALALDPGKGERPSAFMWKRAFRIGVPLVFWTAFYVWFRWNVLSGEYNQWDWGQAIAAGAPFVQLYFLYVLAGLILITPVLRLLTAHGTAATQWGSAAILLAIGVLEFQLRYWVDVGEPNAATRFVPWIGYYVLGYLMRDLLLRGRWLFVGWVVFLGSTAGLVAWAAWGVRDSPWTYSFDFLSPFVVLQSLSAFLLAHRYLRGPLPVLSWLYPLSFGVFFLHPILVYGLRQFIGRPDTVGAVLLHGIGLTIVYAAICALLTWVAIRIPYLRALFGSADPPPPPALVSEDRSKESS